METDIMKLFFLYLKSYTLHTHGNDETIIGLEHESIGNELKPAFFPKEKTQAVKKTGNQSVE